MRIPVRRRRRRPSQAVNPQSDHQRQQSHRPCRYVGRPTDLGEADHQIRELHINTRDTHLGSGRVVDRRKSTHKDAVVIGHRLSIGGHSIFAQSRHKIRIIPVVGLHDVIRRIHRTRIPNQELAVQHDVHGVSAEHRGINEKQVRVGPMKCRQGLQRRQMFRRTSLGRRGDRLMQVAIDLHRQRTSQRRQLSPHRFNLRLPCDVVDE